jgi:hypothetical protein
LVLEVQALQAAVIPNLGLSQHQQAAVLVVIMVLPHRQAVQAVVEEDQVHLGLAQVEQAVKVMPVVQIT